VTLYDKKNQIGGNLLLAAVPPGKEKLLWFQYYLEAQLSKLKVALKLGVEVTPELVDRTGPEALILAAGSDPEVPEIPGISHENVLSAWDLLSEPNKVTGQRVVVAGGGTIGAETAEFLAEKSNTVTVIETLPRIADDMEVVNRRGLLDALEEKKITLLTEHRVEGITDKGLLVTDRKIGKRKIIEADWVVIAIGNKANDRLSVTLKEKAFPLWRVGDCKGPRTILEAVYEGACAAMEI
jgi:pyruvate/2-oxoglutarate dehydrogenase complex dihydrolipoamide dehydrogenase (E3) component